MERLHESIGVFLVTIILVGHAAGASLKITSRSNEVSSSTISHLSGSEGSDKSEDNLGELSRIISDDHDYEPLKCTRDCPKGMCQCFSYTTHGLCCSTSCCTPGGVH